MHIDDLTVYMVKPEGRPATYVIGNDVGRIEALYRTRHARGNPERLTIEQADDNDILALHNAEPNSLRIRGATLTMRDAITLSAGARVIHERRLLQQARSQIASRVRYCWGVTPADDGNGISAGSGCGHEHHTLREAEDCLGSAQEAGGGWIIDAKLVVLDGSQTTDLTHTDWATSYGGLRWYDDDVRAPETTPEPEAPPGVSYCWAEGDISGNFIEGSTCGHDHGTVSDARNCLDDAKDMHGWLYLVDAVLVAVDNDTTRHLTDAEADTGERPVGPATWERYGPGQAPNSPSL